jgi:hypothetical protein
VGQIQIQLSGVVETVRHVIVTCRLTPCRQLVSVFGIPTSEAPYRHGCACPRRIRQFAKAGAHQDK